MSDINLSGELKQMNAYWRLLAGLINEGLGIANNQRLAPEERLDRLRARLEFAQQFVCELPASVRAELDADPEVQAVLKDIADRRETASGEANTIVVEMEDENSAQASDRRS